MYSPHLFAEVLEQLQLKTMHKNHTIQPIQQNQQCSQYAALQDWTTMSYSMQGNKANCEFPV